MVILNCLNAHLISGLCFRKVVLTRGVKNKNNKNDVMRLGERPRSLEGKPNYLDLPFAIKLYYSMSTISYTPWFSYQINMTLIECPRTRKDRDHSLGEATQGRHDSMFKFQHPGLVAS